MCDLYFAAERLGHFRIDPKIADAMAFSEANFHSIIVNQAMLDKRRAQSMIFEYGNERIGYAIVAELATGKGGTELHIFIVDPNARGKGYGQLMLTEIIHRWHVITDLFVVCFPASSTMKHLLMKNGFLEIEVDKEGNCLFLLPKAHERSA